MTLNIQPPHARSQAEVIEGLNELRRMVIESPTNIELLKRIDDSDWIMPVDAIDLDARRMKGLDQ